MWNDPAGYGIYLLDVFGNRVPIYGDPAISCWQARPLEPRPRAAACWPMRSRWPRTADGQGGHGGGGRRLPGAGRRAAGHGEVSARSWSRCRGRGRSIAGIEPNDASPGQMVAISLYTHLSVKVLHGVVPVCEDGSACFTVPAERNIFLQALDGDFMEVQRMRTFVNFQPGEHRSCIGCHEQRNRGAARAGRSLALSRPPARPQPQPGDTGPRPIHYPTDVQPIFDRHCVVVPQREEGRRRPGPRRAK